MDIPSPFIITKKFISFLSVLGNCSISVNISYHKIKYYTSLLSNIFRYYIHYCILESKWVQKCDHESNQIMIVVFEIAMIKLYLYINIISMASNIEAEVYIVSIRLVIIGWKALLLEVISYVLLQ